MDFSDLDTFNEYAVAVKATPIPSGVSQAALREICIACRSLMAGKRATAAQALATVIAHEDYEAITDAQRAEVLRRLGAA